MSTYTTSRQNTKYLFQKSTKAKIYVIFIQTYSLLF